MDNKYLLLVYMQAQGHHVMTHCWLYTAVSKCQASLSVLWLSVSIHWQVENMCPEHGTGFAKYGSWCVLVLSEDICVHFNQATVAAKQRVEAEQEDSHSAKQSGFIRNLPSKAVPAWRQPLRGRQVRLECS